MFMRTSTLACAITLLETMVLISNGSNVQKRQATQDLCRNKEDGFHSHPENCEWYIWCLVENGYIMKCPSGTHFDRVSKLCTWPFMANCKKLSFANSLWSTLADEGKLEDGDTSSESGNSKNKDNDNKKSKDAKNSKDGNRDEISNNGKCTRVVCYFTNWAQYRPENGQHNPEDIDASMCTHIIHAFAQITNNKLDTFEWNDDDLIQRLMKHKKSNRDLKILISVGGTTMRSEPFTKMVKTTATRNVFIESAIEFLRSYDFEGLDIDWEFPTLRGGVPEDKKRFIYLLEELRYAFDNEDIPPGKNKLLLTAAVAAGRETIDKAYAVAELSHHCDFINFMAYELHGSWDKKTGHNSPLQEVKESAEYWIEKGGSRHKLVIGLPFYGRTFTLLDRNLKEYGAQATSGIEGDFTGEDGFLAYYEICDILKKPETSKHLHNGTDPYCVSGDQWIGYDDENSLKRKVDFIIKENFGGAMIWGLGEDDFKGKFCGKGEYPLMNAVIKSCKLT